MAIVVAAIFTNSDQLPLIMGFAAPWITVLFASAGIVKTVEDVQRKVNGNFNALSARNQVIESQLMEVAKNLTPQQANAFMTEPLPVVIPEHAADDLEEGRHRT